MIDINELRRLAYVSPTVISELLDRLEAAEAEAFEQARLNGMGSEREAALMAKLEAAERERDALRAKIEQMERQAPVAFVLNAPKLKRCAALLDAGKKLPHKTKLYALPGAQHAPSVPENKK